MECCIVSVAVDPPLAFGHIQDERVSGGMMVLGGVLVLRAVAAPHLPADQAHPQVDPGIARIEALLADLRPVTVTSI